MWDKTWKCSLVVAVGWAVGCSSEPPPSGDDESGEGGTGATGGANGGASMAASGGAPTGGTATGGATTGGASTGGTPTGGASTGGTGVGGSAGASGVGGVNGGAPPGDDWIGVVLNRDTQGRFASDLGGPDALCPPGGQYLGAAAQASVCGAPGYRHVVQMQSDATGAHYSELPTPGDVCPNGWTHLAGNFLWEMCGAGAKTAIVLDRDRAGLAYDSENLGRLCPAGTRFVGTGAPWNAGVGEVCEYDTEYTFVQLTTNTSMVDRDSLPSVGDVCPSEWEFVGSYFGYTVCVRPGPGAVVYVDTDTQGRSYPDTLSTPEATCPAGWTWLGDYSGDRACFTAEHHAVAYVAVNAQGESRSELDNESEMCATGWEHVGRATFTYCVR
jgi:hypothetical protein